MGKRFLFVMPPLHGHLNPTVAVAKELLRRGHEVAWVTSKSVRPMLPEGAVVYDSVSEEYEAHPAETQELIELPRNEQFFRYYRDLVIPAATRTLDDVMRGCAEFRPGALFVDQNALAGAVAATRLGLPWATSAPSHQFASPLPHLVQPWIDERVAELGEACGVPGLREVSEELLLSYSSPLLAVNGSFPPQTRFVGPAIDPDRFEDSDLVPLLRPGRRILVSLSTIYGYHGDALVSKVANVLARLDIQGLFSTSSSTLEEFPAPALVRPWLPIVALLPHVHAVISHGGSNTAHEALYFGRPLILTPLAFDNFMVAQSVVSAGAGIRLRARRASENDLARAIDEVLHNESYRAAAGTIGASLRAGGGAAAAADALLELVA